MISTVSGDILLSEAHAIAHGIAPHDHFNQGLALALRENFPSMAKDFRHYCHLENPKAGHAWLWAGPNKIIVNLMTQEPAPTNQSHPGKATMHNVNSSLGELRKIIQEEKISSIALPRLATGVGGLDWEDVKASINSNLADLRIPVIVYEKYVSNEKAAEKLRRS